MEIWKDIKDFEGKYQISNKGRVKSLNYLNTGKEKILSPRLNKRGIYTVNLYKNNKAYNFSVALLVARAFLKKNNEDDVVIHIKEKTNDDVNNLKYVSQCEARYYQRNKSKIVSTIDEIYTNGQINKYKKEAEGKGINVYQMYRRLYDGWSIEEAVNIPIKRNERILKKKLYMYNGKYYSVKQLSEISNISRFTIYKRLARDWSVVEAVETPLSKKYREDKNYEN